MTRLPFALVLVVGLGCEETPAEPETWEVEFNEPDTTVLPRLDDPFSMEETRSMREGFDWSTTSPLEETDPDGHPAIRYAVAYLATDDERVLLDAVGPHSPLPLFAAERGRWDDQVGRFGFFGDGEGLFHFVILPASTYNVLRELALDGEPPFQALILREAPIDEAMNEDGSLDYQWLADRSFTMDDDEPSIPARDDGIGGTTEPLFGLIVALLVSRDARDAVDDTLGVITRVGREGTNTVRLILRSTDPTHADVTRTWGVSGMPGTNAGDPLVLRGVEVIGEFEVGTSRGRTNWGGTATVSVPVGARVHYCVRANNYAAQVDEGFEASQICNFRMSAPARIRNAVDGARINIFVADPVFNIVAQMTDARDYSRRVMGHTVSHRGVVLIGPFADLFGGVPGQNNRAFTLCGGYTSAVNHGWDAIATAIGGVLSVDAFSSIALRALVHKILSHDFIFPMHGSMEAAFSRVIPTHEYGHFLQCDMLSVLGGDGDFTEAWSDVIWTTLFGGVPEGTTESLSITEGIADYFSAQIAGGFGYFRGAAGSGLDDRFAYYCDPTVATCLEDNVGGPDQVVPLNRLSRSAGTVEQQQFDEEIARITTLLIDAVDGPRGPLVWASDPPTAGAHWVQSPTGQLVRPSTPPRTSRLDELVALEGGFMSDTFLQMSTMGNTLNRANFFGALARVARREYSDAEVCDMFALHADDGMCTSLATADDLMDAPIGPSAPVIISGSVGTTNTATWQWTDISSAATSYVIEIVDGDGLFVVPRTLRPYARRDTYSQDGLGFDASYTFRVATANMGAIGPFATHTVHTFAEPVGEVTGVPLAGAARLSWTPVDATEYTVHDVTGGGDAIVARTTGAESTIRGLAGGVSRTYVVVSYNAIGLPSDASATVDVVPLDPTVVYVSPTGSDAAPSAGSATSPFRTIQAALARAAATSAQEVVMEAAAFAESGPLRIDSDLALRGGFTFSAGTWTPSGARTLLTVSGAGAVSACSTESFNSADRAGSAAIIVGGDATVSVRDIDITADRPAATAAECFSAVHVSGDALSVEQSSVSTNGMFSSICTAGITAARGSSLTLRSSSVRGGVFPSATSVLAGFDAAGVAACEGATLLIEDSTLSGLDAPMLVTPLGIGALVGLAGDNLTSVRVQRSAFDAIAMLYRWRATAGSLAGIQFTATGRVFIANSVVRTPQGADVNRAIDIGSRVGPLRSLQLYHVTAVVGADWGASDVVPLPFDGAVVSLSGDILDLVMFNNLLSYAGGGIDLVNGTTFTGVDRVRVSSDHETVSFAGNVVSIPYVSDWHLSSLTTCGSFEFRTARSEWQLNTPEAHECYEPISSSFMVARNAAFTAPPGMGPRAVVQFMLDGRSTNPAATFVVGEPIATLPLSSEVATDFVGATRGTPPGVGAYQ